MLESDEIEQEHEHDYDHEKETAPETLNMYFPASPFRDAGGLPHPLWSVTAYPQE